MHNKQGQVHSGDVANTGQDKAHSMPAIALALGRIVEFLFTPYTVSSHHKGVGESAGLAAGQTPRHPSQLEVDMLPGWFGYSETRTSGGET